MSKHLTVENIAQYIAEINRIYRAGNATEHTYRPALKSLLEAMANGLTVTNEPKRIACGAPDYIVTRKEIPVGYVEAKDIVTARDSVVIDIDKKTLQNRIQKFCDSTISDDEIRKWLFPSKSDGKYLAGDSRGWKLPEARKKIAKNNHEELIQDINYRPFDTRKIYYTPAMVDWGRENVMQHFLKGENVGLVIPKINKEDNCFFISDKIIGHKHCSAYDSNTLFPLYIYPEVNKLFSDENRKHNLNNAYLDLFSLHTGLQFTEEKEEAENTFAPIDVLDYIYAVLHSPTYREKYKEFLKIDFPRVPYPENTEQFWKLVVLGGKLRSLHLLEGVEPQQGMADFPIAGSNEIEKPYYSPPCMEGWQPQADGVVSAQAGSGRVYINDTQYFDNVPLVAWNFYIGGYQPAQKWLKDRKGRTLNFEDIRHYQKMIWVLRETGEVMRKVDEVMDITM